MGQTGFIDCSLHSIAVGLLINFLPLIVGPRRFDGCIVQSAHRSWRWPGGRAAL